jgi:hypothetical protein
MRIKGTGDYSLTKVFVWWGFEKCLKCTDKIIFEPMYKRLWNSTSQEYRYLCRACYCAQRLMGQDKKDPRVREEGPGEIGSWGGPKWTSNVIQLQKDAYQKLTNVGILNDR